MRRLILILSLVLATATSAFAADWAVLAPSVKESIVEIAVGTEGACTGFVIDNDRDFVMTAAHCDVASDSQTLFVDNLKAEVRAKDTKNDLMVLYVKDIDRPALKLAPKNPNVGDEVASYGYGYALEQPLFRVAHISAKDVAIERSRYISIDSTFVPGQSGGPVVNDKGEVVMIVQLGSPIVGFGVGAETLHDKVGRFFSLKK